MSNEAGARHMGLGGHVPRNTHEEHGRFLEQRDELSHSIRYSPPFTDLSHFSLLFLQGSQFIALRARFVGGRPSPFCSPGVGDVLPLTVPVAFVLPAFGRGGAEEVEVGLSSAIQVAVFQD
jgi:hypothetical protein